MSITKDDINRTAKSIEKSSNNNSCISFTKIKSNDNCVSKVMTNFLDNIVKKQQNIQKQIKNFNSTIIDLQKRRSKIMSKNNFLLSLSTSKFPLIESRYKDIFLSQKQKNKDDNSSITKNKNTSFTNLNIKEIKKSKSEYKINNDTKYKNKDNNFFQTSLGRNYKFSKFNINSNLNNNENETINITNKEINKEINKDINRNEEKNENINIDDGKVNADNNIIYRLAKISNQNLKNMPVSDEENLKEKIVNINPHSTMNKESDNKMNYFNISKHGRKKKFKIEVIKGWEFSNGLNVNNFDFKVFIEDKEYQKNLISNQIDIIIDNTNYFKLNHINILTKYIKNDDLNEKYLIIINKLLEETSALYIEISHLIIKDFESFLFIKHKLKPCSPPEMIDGVEVNDEKLEFGVNIKLLNECTKFLNSSYEIYLVLNGQTNYIIQMKKFLKIRHFLNRARYNINNLVSISKKYIEDLKYEKGIINQFNEQQDLIDKNLKVKNKQYSNCDRITDGLESLNEKKKNYQNIGVDKMRRLNNLINPKNRNNNEIYKSKRYIGKHIDASDKMFNKIVEYMEPSVKERFEAFSVTQKKVTNKNKRKVYKFDF